MKLAALFSGGKDSAYSVYSAQKQGHSVECLVTVSPASPESMLLHHPNIDITKLQATAMQMPQKYAASSSDAAMELATLHTMLDEVRHEHGIRGVVHGGILSRFQLDAFEKICGRLGLEMISPVWHKDQVQYMRELLDEDFRFIITAVAAGGLDGSWLGREITRENLPVLEGLSERFGFNLSFEGGEAETLVIDCPLFTSPILVTGSAHWDGYRGFYKISGARQAPRAG